MQQNRTCTKCKMEKPESAFTRTKLFCKLCVNAAARAKYAEDPSKATARVNRYHEKNPNQQANTALKSKYGITIDDYNDLLEAQDGKCGNPSCHAIPGARRFHVDHDHKCCPGQKTCGKCIRSLLCAGCNMALGLMHEDAERLMGLARYALNSPAGSGAPLPPAQSVPTQKEA